MKKVLALVLAVMMLSTMAFATGSANKAGTSTSHDVAILGGDFVPGEKIYVYKGMTSTVDGTVSGVFDKEVNSSNYTITKVKYEEGKNLVESVEFDDANDQVVIKLKKNDALTATKKLDMSFTLKGKGRNVSDVNLTIQADVGYQLITNAIYVDVNNDVDISAVTNAKRNFYKVIDSGAAYGTMEFETQDPDVELSVRVYKNDKHYLYNTVDANKDILKAYADADAELTFLNFPGDTTFNATATVYMYKEEDSFVYENKDGKLVNCNAKWDDDEGCFILKTRTLGSYVFSDKKLSVSAADAGTQNPDTGANDVVGIAGALAAVALVSAAAVSLKK